MENKAKVFISYATEDCEMAKKLYDDLKKAGVEPWLDKEDLRVGENWQATIPQVIRECSYFLLLISKYSVTKQGYVQKEQKIALELLELLPLDKIFIIPVRIDCIEPIDEKLKVLQWTDLTDYHKGLEKILKVIKPINISKLDNENSEGSIEDSFFWRGVSDSAKPIVIIPGRNRPPLKNRMSYKNRPFKYDLAPDDVWTMSMLLPHIRRRSNMFKPYIRPEDFKFEMHSAIDYQIIIGSPISNSLCESYFRINENSLPIVMKGYDIYYNNKIAFKSEIKDDEITRDFGLISKHKKSGKVYMVLAGSHTFGQIAIAFALSDSSFYREIKNKCSFEQFQIVISVNIRKGNSWPDANYNIEELIPLY